MPKAKTKWVDFIDFFLFGSYNSTNERRIVKVNSGSPVGYIPAGTTFKASFFQIEYDTLAFVNMGPKEVVLDLDGKIRTNDGVAINGTVSLNVFLKDLQPLIYRMVVDDISEEQFLKNLAYSAIQDEFRSIMWSDIIGKIDILERSIGSILGHLMVAKGSCFSLICVSLHDIIPKNTNLLLAFEASASAKEDKKLKKELITFHAEMASLEREAKRKEAEGELEIQKIRLKIEKEAEEHRMKLEQEREDAKIALQSRLSMLLKTEEGRLAALPSETFAYLTREIDARIACDQERLEFLKQMIHQSQSFQAGQIDATRALLEQQFNIKLSDNRVASTEQNTLKAVLDSQARDVLREKKQDEASPNATGNQSTKIVNPINTLPVSEEP